MPDWNYDKNGTDWDFSSCNETKTNAVAQSPRNLTHVTDGVKRVYDWANYYFAFTPKFYSSMIDVEGAKDYVYQITIKDNTENMGF